MPHVIIGSGIAISGATLCLSLTHLDYFRTLGPPCAVSMVVAVLAALTLGPALLTIGSKIGWIQPRKKRANPVWRKVGTVIARWPVPMIALAALIIPLCMLGWTTYKVSYNDRDSHRQASRPAPATPLPTSTSRRAGSTTTSCT